MNAQTDEWKTNKSTNYQKVIPVNQWVSHSINELKYVSQAEGHKLFTSKSEYKILLLTIIIDF